MNRQSDFRIQDLIVITCILTLFLTLALPTLCTSAGKSRKAVCSNNIRLTGLGLNMWRDNSLSGTYPVWDMASNQYLHPWCDMIAMQGQYTPQWIEGNRQRIESVGMLPEDFGKYVDDGEIFMCPADHAHPHRINEGRSMAWGFWRNQDEDGYEYSYTLNHNVASSFNRLDKDPSRQCLTIDGLWTFSMNFSGYYLDDPNNYWGSPNWYSNTVGYFHGVGSQARANVCVRDNSVKSVRWGSSGDGIDTEKVYFIAPGESIDVYE